MDGVSIYDRESELKSFDETKAGVKGLVDAGITEIPRFFIQPPGDAVSAPPHYLQIPIIDLSCIRSHRRHIVEQVKRAAESFGFFQLVNHGIPQDVLDEMLRAVRRFHEAAPEEKSAYYSREAGRKVSYTSNFDLYQAPVANWRDSVFCVMAPDPPPPEELPIACRDVALEYSGQIERLGIVVFELLAEAMGLTSNHLIEMECARGHALVMNYYPPCPQPQLTLGTSKHSDPDFLTILLQDHIGGLQVLHQHYWIDVPPLPGALVVNIGDLLQLILNDKLRSIEHRVLANNVGPRVSVACFFTMHLYPTTQIYGPIRELLSDQCPPVYRQIHLQEYISHYESKGLDGRPALDYFKL
ncbi:hypothetical protein J5N97_024206 [Dioscorea zingiberensis]|uniref:Fe2OG dioxygenase domain-containing protein n=1 Tax=Dioscorea zingiberensis TaxID=325984 RepID=A0A9D5C707_9LILI|nr:hypothetical protein J5N97_024206 [Dioscorea zingiberensis]